MSAFDLNESMARAQSRQSSPRAARTDKGTTRFSARVEAELQRLLSTTEKPSVLAVTKQLQETCKRWREPAPSRASIYNAIARVEPPVYRVEDLPHSVRDALLNVDNAEIEGARLAFNAFNYGSPEALCFAAGLPWICLVRASQLRGHRPKSYALLQAVLAYRGII
jgi:hypothetical protein